MKNKIVPVLCVLSAAGFALSVYFTFYVAPLEYSLTESGRLSASSLFFSYTIFYFHIGHAFALFTAVFVAGGASVGFLVTRKSKWDDVASAATDVAVAFGAAVLVTGSVWAKAAWDVWWEWEPRLTMSLLLWLILLGCVLVRQFAGTSATRVAAGMTIFGMVGVPFIYTMVGQDSHPAAGANGVVANIAPPMAGAMWISVATFHVWFAALMLFRTRSARAERELRELRERALDLGVLE